MKISRFAVTCIASVLIPSNINPISPFLSLNIIAADNGNSSMKRHKLSKKSKKEQSKSPTESPNDEISKYNVSFQHGREGWSSHTFDEIGNDSGTDFYLHTLLLDSGIFFENFVHNKFVGDFFEKGVVELGLDLRVNSILFDGLQVPRNLVLKLEDDTGVGIYIISERDLEQDDEMQRPVFSTFSFPIPLQEDFPTGWGGYDTGYNPPFPTGRTFGSVLRNVQRIRFTTYVLGMAYSERTLFDIDADNIFIVSKQ